jgi:hypothetical protein
MVRGWRFRDETASRWHFVVVTATGWRSRHEARKEARKSEGAVPAATRLPHRRRRPEAFPAREPVGLAEMNVIGDTCDDVAEG